MSSWSPNGACSNKEPAQKQKLITARRGGLALALLCSAAAMVRAQDAPPGFVARFDVTQRLEYSDNPDLDVDGDSDFYGRTILNFGLESSTSLQRFDLNLGAEIEEFRDDPDDPDNSDLDLANANFRLGYVRDTRNALVGADLRYRESDVFSTFFDEDFDQDGNVINQDSGTRVSYGYGLRGAVGREAPIGASFDWRYNKIEYRDTDDPDLNDSTLNELNGQIDFRISPRITTSLNALYRDFDPEDGGVARETTGLGAGVAMDISPIWSASFGLRHDRIERTGDETDTDEGLSVNAGATRLMPNGDWQFRFSSDVASNDNGRRSYVSAARSLDLPRGALSLELGLTGAGDVIGTDPLVQANYRHVMRSSQLTFGFSQRVNVDDDNNEDINTRLRATYDRQINSLSSLGVSLSFFDRNELDEGDNDGQRLDLSLSYRYDLTRDWGLVTGYSHTLSTEDDSEDRTRNTVFVGLQRSFNWSP